MKITLIGTGYVGLVTGACFAEVGHHVLCVDNDREKISTLKTGRIPIYEPGLEDLVKNNVAAGRLAFSDSTQHGVEHGDVIFIAVPTPPQADGSVDLTYIEAVAREIAQCLRPGQYRVIVDKSTVPVKTGEKVAETIKRYCSKGCEFDVVSNPEFLREGCAVADLMQPDRIVIGSRSQRATDIMKAIYEPFHAPIYTTDINSAELIKHAANSFLALKISYINAIAAICEAAGANVDEVADGIGADKRIGRAFLNAGLGYGGSCFPKDIKAFIHISEELGVPFNLLKEVEKINSGQLDRFLQKIKNKLWVLKNKTLGVLGLAFKCDTDDVRCSVSIELCQRLLNEGALLRVTDPQALAKARAVLGEVNVTYCENPADVFEKVEAVILATEWKQFRNLPWRHLKDMMIAPIVFDGRNLLDYKSLRDMGYDYIGVGRP